MSWPMKTLGEVCQLRPEKSEARARLSATANVSFVPMEDLGINAKWVKAVKSKPFSDVAGSYTYFAEGDVLLAKITPCFENGKLGIAADLDNGAGFGSSEYFVLRPNATVSAEWLYHYLNRESFRLEGAARMSGAVGHRRVTKEFIEHYPIPVPPLSEQQRIVRLLDEAFEGIATAKANAEKNLQKARALFESHLQAVFTQSGNGWTDKALEEICVFSNGLWKGEKPPFERVGVIRNTNFTRNGMLDHSDIAFLDVEVKKLEKRRLKYGDIILEKSGGGPKQAVGRVALFEKEAGAFSFSNFTAALRVTDPGTVDFRFLHKFLYWTYLSGATEGMQSNSTGIRNLDGDAYKSIRFRFPPLAEQRKIVSLLDELQVVTGELARICSAKRASLEDLKESLLHQAFAGQLKAA
jgi:type I restriction enzyme S subunit